jgi:hypothetical protein
LRFSCFEIRRREFHGLEGDYFVRGADEFNPHATWAILFHNTFVERKIKIVFALPFGGPNHIRSRMSGAWHAAPGVF